MHAYLRQITRDLSAAQRATVTAAATDEGNVPPSTRPSTLGALYDKRLIHPTANPSGRRTPYTLTALGHRVADVLAEQARTARWRARGTTVTAAALAGATLTAEDRRDVLRATVRPRTEAPQYAISVHGTTAPAWTTVTTWGTAMASAQKSIRNGATITPGRGGAFTLTSPNGGRRAHFRPA